MEAIILEEKPADGVTLVNGKEYMANAKGALVPLELVKPQEKLRDESVRKVMAYAVDISARIARFRAHCMDDLDALDAVLEQEYGAKSGGIKGNRTYQTIDGLMRVSVAINDFETAGPELQVAKSLIDECLNEWTSDARVEIRALPSIRIKRARSTSRKSRSSRSWPLRTSGGCRLFAPSTTRSTSPIPNSISGFTSASPSRPNGPLSPSILPRREERP